MIQEFDSAMMRRAIALAEQAAGMGEVPVGAVICMGTNIVAEAHNRRETDKNALAHAELLAIDTACRALGGWRLHQCTLYVTLEPCPMCTGAVINARVKRVVYGANDPKAGCLGSLADFTGFAFNHRPEVVAGVLADECAGLLRNFFAELRKTRS